MIKILLLLILAFPVYIQAQELKKVTLKKEESFLKYKEVFYVLKSNPEIRQGSYQKSKDKYIVMTGYYKNGKKDSIWTEYGSYSKDIENTQYYKNDMKEGAWIEYGYNKNIETSGFYKNGLKDSIWTTYYSSGMKRSTKKYQSNEQIVIWEIYDEKGDVELTYDYTKKEVLYVKSSEPVEAKVVIGTDTLLTKVDRLPIYIDGKYGMRTFLAQNIYYPEHATANEIQGKVYISFVIDENGKTSGHKILKGFDLACDEEALRVVKMLPDHWIPAVLKGENVAVLFIMPVSFKLQ